MFRGRRRERSRLRAEASLPERARGSTPASASRLCSSAAATRATWSSAQTCELIGEA